MPADLNISQSILFRTSLATDALDSGNFIRVAGLNPVNKDNVISIRQVKYRAEVVQVKTIGNNSYTPVGATLYQIAVFDDNRRVSGAQEQIKYYGYTTSADLSTEGATDALRREYIHAKIVLAVNAETSTNHSVALSLGTGTGFTITDVGGYYPTRSQTMTNVKGYNTVLTTNGFTAAPTASTDAVYQNGVGAILAGQAPVTDWMAGGNVISGDPKAPRTLAGLYAVSGQNYDAFVIVSLALASNETMSGQQIALVNQIQTIWVDNGTGSATTNLTGFLAFERQMHKLMYQVYSKDTNSIGEFFDKGYVMQANPGITPYTGTIAGTADVMKFFTTPYATKLEQYNINAQTIFAPLEVDAGLRVEQDVNATDGAHYCAGTLAFAPNSFIVGKQAFACYARVVAGDWTDAFFMVGFRKKAVYAADYTTYDDLGAIGTQVSAANDYVATQGNINNGTMKETVSTTAIAADGVSVTLSIKVAIDGTVTAFRNNVAFPIYSAGTTTLIFDAGDEMIPFFQFINVNSSASTLTFSELIAVADVNFIS